MMKLVLHVVLFFIIGCLVGDKLQAQQPFDPGHQDIDIQGVGSSIKRCQFNPKKPSTKINGIDVPNDIIDPSVRFEQHKVGAEGEEITCMMPMVRGKKQVVEGTINYWVNVICFTAQFCES